MVEGDLRRGVDRILHGDGDASGSRMHLTAIQWCRADHQRTVAIEHNPHRVVSRIDVAGTRGQRNRLDLEQHAALTRLKRCLKRHVILAVSRIRLAEEQNDIIDRDAVLGQILAGELNIELAGLW